MFGQHLWDLECVCVLVLANLHSHPPLGFGSLALHALPRHLLALRLSRLPTIALALPPPWSLATVALFKASMPRPRAGAPRPLAPPRPRALLTPAAMMRAHTSRTRSG